MSEMNFTQAAEEVRKIVRGFKAVEQVSSVLEQIGSVEQAGREAESRLSDLRAKVAAEKAALEEASELVVAAKGNAKRITDDAKNKAATIMAKADAMFAEKVAESDAVEVAAINRANEMDVKLSEKMAKIKEADSELAVLNGKIAAAKAQIVSLLNG